MDRFLVYMLARRSAARMDQAGQRPGVVIRALTAIVSLSVLGLVACMAFVVIAAALWSVGIG